jgi:hypothetical protein
MHLGDSFWDLLSRGLEVSLTATGDGTLCLSAALNEACPIIEHQ